MKTIHLKWIVLSMLLILALAACSRPASVAPLPTATPDVPFPVMNTPQILDEIIRGTQTAAAVLNSPTPGAQKPVNTPEPQPTSQPKPEKPMPTEGRPAAYTVKKGDHFLCIARRYNLNPNELASLNGFGAWPETLVVGTSLKLPSGGSFPGDRSLRSHPATYTVQAGETINSIACKFGDVLPEAILAKNGIGESELTAGMSLQIP